ncbi:MAG: hypothetical protein AVDCRST_MAG89-2185 [uncultured Gemmatimonadetes bacterium]|uniref:Xylose isomerase-like TIM barrel domain-containing protein n=1 Tax=uncultured Gemmatimonadota bacterium TaxID=203437 RepID=A0A6J4LHZ8_9BACT|nr:MAG: hypothetical protein AVDCRST_MAG89-2185 [uncultured Gemmatimonadota bacterium]
MECIGFSTGSIAWSDAGAALALLRGHHTDAVELSALRIHELGPLVASLPTLPLGGYHYVAVHAPSAFPRTQERTIARALRPVAERGWQVVVHPDTLHDAGVWAEFGTMLCVENMDRRKPVGRTAAEMRAVFNRLPAASFCLDLAHARQCDPSMHEVVCLLQGFGDRISQVHLSEVNEQSRHVRLSEAAAADFERVAPLIPAHVPVIIESPVQSFEIGAELEICLRAMGRAPVYA